MHQQKVETNYREDALADKNTAITYQLNRTNFISSMRLITAANKPEDI